MTLLKLFKKLTAKFSIQEYNLNRILYILGGLAIVSGIFFVFWWNKEIVISKNNEGQPKEGVVSSIAGIACEGAGNRPIAVMLAGDREARPLSGISQADMVFEMPVAPNGITRMMAVYQCAEPKEIGSVRSSRDDFIPLAAGLKAIYAHWGGEHDALQKLNNKIIDNIDALKYEGKIFYRKRGVPAPHNGFTTLELLRKGSRDLGYNLENEFEGYPRTDKTDQRSLTNLASSVNVGYNEPFDVVWTYDSASGTYKRARNGRPELDKNNQEQVSVPVVVIMETTSSFIREQYIRVNVQGEGPARIYQGGGVTNGRWKKDPSKIDSKIYFYDTQGKEIKFLPGKMWVEIVAR